MLYTYESLFTYEVYSVGAIRCCSTTVSGGGRQVRRIGAWSLEDVCWAPIRDSSRRPQRTLLLSSHNLSPPSTVICLPSHLIIIARITSTTPYGMCAQCSALNRIFVLSSHCISQGVRPAVHDLFYSTVTSRILSASDAAGAHIASVHPTAKLRQSVVHHDTLISHGTCRATNVGP